MEIRRVITGLTNEGSAFVSDAPATAISPPLIGNEIVRLWGFDVPPETPNPGGLMPDSAQFFPPAGGMRAVVWTAPPASVAGHAPGDDAARARTDELVPGMADVPIDEQGLHVTASIDLQFVLEGEVDLVLDGGQSRTLCAGDFAVVNGVSHAWRNRTERACRLLAVFYGTETS